MDIVTLTYEGNYVGQSKGGVFDLFNYQDSLWKVNRLTGECVQVAKEFESFYLEPTPTGVVYDPY